ncbi:MAG: aminotransferase, partial [Methylobacter sp.]
CRAEGFAIWTTLSEPVQIRIGILNQLTVEAITEIVSRFADAMIKMGVDFNKDQAMEGLKTYYAA